MDDIITFNKSLKQRFEEYREVFDALHNLPVSLQECWSLYLQYTIDSAGWQAVWKIPRLTCESLCIPFPSLVLVLVTELNFDKLTAVVRVLAVQDDILIPDVHHPALIELWCTKGQNTTVDLDIAKTANAIDILRFCYLYLLRPWDELDDTVNWASEHLEERLGLYYDLKNGSIPRAAAEHIHYLLTQARYLENKKKLLFESCDGDLEGEYIEAIKEIEMELLEIRPHIDIAENVAIRDVLVKKLITSDPKHSNNEREIWVIYDQATADDYSNFLDKVKQRYPLEPLRFCTSLAHKLVNSSTTVDFVLNESKHLIETTGILEEGGSLLGVGLKENILLASHTDGTVLDFGFGNVTIENITIIGGKAQCALLIRKSKVTMKHCKIIGDGHSSIQEGISVFSGGKLHLEDCEISRFHVAVIGCSKANITIKNCCVNMVDIGVKVFDDCKLNIQDSSITHCREYGLVLETSQKEHEMSVGDFGIFSRFTDIKVLNVSGSTNTKGDAIIVKKRS